MGSVRCVRCQFFYCIEKIVFPDGEHPVCVDCYSREIALPEALINLKESENVIFNDPEQNSLLRWIK